jgi:hypothetical protein
MWPYTLQVGRRVFEHRRIVVCQDVEDAIAALQHPKRVLTWHQETSERICRLYVSWFRNTLHQHGLGTNPG